MPVILGGNSGAGGIVAADYWDGKPIFAGQIRYVPTYWDDLRVPATSVQGGGGSNPSFDLVIDNGAGSNGVYAWRFKEDDVRELFFWAQIPHSWKQGSTIQPHIHWLQETAAAGTVLWGLEYAVASPLGVFPNSTIITFLDTSSGVAFEHQVTSLPNITLNNKTLSTMLGCRVFRDGTGDTLADFADLLEVDFHFELNTPGSRQPFIK